MAFVELTRRRCPNCRAVAEFATLFEPFAQADALFACKTCGKLCRLAKRAERSMTALLMIAALAAMSTLLVVGLYLYCVGFAALFRVGGVFGPRDQVIALLIIVLGVILALLKGLLAAFRRLCAVWADDSLLPRV